MNLHFRQFVARYKERITKQKLLLCSLALTLSLLACQFTDLPFPIPNVTPSRTPQALQFPKETSSQPTVQFSWDAAPFNYGWADREPFRFNLSTFGQAALSGLPGATVYHLAILLNDPLRQLQGAEEIRYTNTEVIPLEEIDIALFPELLGGKMTILETQLDGHPITPIIEGWLMRLPLTHPLEPGQAVTLRILFEVEIPSGGGDYYYGIFGYNSGILSLAHAYPTVLVYNQEGWNNQVPDLDGDPLFADTSFYLVSVDAPANLVVVSAGIELERSETGGKQQILIANGPARDFYLAASSNWVKQSQVIGEVTVNTYAPAGEQEAENALNFGVAVIDTFSQRYGAYPYTEFDIAPIITSAGGVEYPGMTSIAQDAFGWGSFLETIIVHEAAHMWFYNLVGNDTLDQPWLDESLAQFATWQYYLDQYGAGEAESYLQYDLQSNWDMAADPNTPIGLPVSAYPGYEYVSIIYGRGAFFFLALRDTMGIETFDAFMRAYVQQYSWGIATTEGFKTLAESFCNCNLTPLFDEWVYP